MRGEMVPFPPPRGMLKRTGNFLQPPQGKHSNRSCFLIDFCKTSVYNVVPPLLCLNCRMDQYHVVFLQWVKRWVVFAMRAGSPAEDKAYQRRPGPGPNPAKEWWLLCILSPNEWQLSRFPSILLERMLKMTFLGPSNLFIQVLRHALSPEPWPESKSSRSKWHSTLPEVSPYPGWPS